jgi:hypothetical protein
MKRYEGRRVLLRPSNLEDVFLQLVGDGVGGEESSGEAL